MSKQARWQQKMSDEGRCITCGQPHECRTLKCNICKEVVRKRNRTNYRKKRGIPLDAPVMMTKPQIDSKRIHG